MSQISNLTCTINLGRRKKNEVKFYFIDLQAHIPQIGIKQYEMRDVIANSKS